MCIIRINTGSGLESVTTHTFYVTYYVMLIIVFQKSRPDPFIFLWFTVNGQWLMVSRNLFCVSYVPCVPYVPLGP